MALKTPMEIARTACTSSRSKVSLSITQIVILGFQAGAYVAFGGWFMISVTRDMSSGLGALLGGTVFCVGLILVLIAGAELFTGNCIIPLGVLAGCVPLRGMLRNWVLVYLANFLGAALLAWLTYQTGLWRGATGVKALSIAAAKMNLPWGEIFFRGILCNWLVVLAVWASMAADDVVGKIAALFFPITAFVASGFEHCVANMYFLTLGLFLRGEGLPVDPALVAEITPGGLLHNLVPSTLGNIVGGVLFVAPLYFAAFREGLNNPAGMPQASQ